jgi:hypothetical protein
MNLQTFSAPDVRFLRSRANVTPLIPSTSMPNFGETSLPDDRAKDIHAWIRTFKAPHLTRTPFRP